MKLFLGTESETMIQNNDLWHLNFKLPIVKQLISFSCNIKLDNPTAEMMGPFYDTTQRSSVIDRM